VSMLGGGLISATILPPRLNSTFWMPRSSQAAPITETVGPSTSLSPAGLMKVRVGASSLWYFAKTASTVFSSA